MVEGLFDVDEDNLGDPDKVCTGGDMEEDDEEVECTPETETGPECDGTPETEPTISALLL